MPTPRHSRHSPRFPAAVFLVTWAAVTGVLALGQGCGSNGADGPPLPDAGLVDSGGVQIRIDLAESLPERAEERLRAGVVTYLREYATPSSWTRTWGRFSQEQRVGVVLVDPREAFTSSSDQEDLLRRIARLDTFVDQAVSAGGQVHMIFFVVPRWLSSDPDNDSPAGPGQEVVWMLAPPADLSLWSDLIAAIVDHFNNGLGFGERITYVFGAEPDNYWLGTESEFYEYYAASVAGALRADPDARIGGITPSSVLADHFTSNYRYTGRPEDRYTEGNRPLAYNWLRYCAKEGLPLTVFTWHSYPAGSPVPVDSTIWEREARTARSWLAETGYSDVELVIHDWPAWKAGPPEENDGPYKAAWTIAGLRALLHAEVDHATYLNLTDIELTLQGEDLLANGTFGGGVGLFTKATVPKSVYYAYRLLGLMEGRLVPVETGDDFLVATASVAGNAVCAMFVSFVPSEALFPYNDFLPGIDLPEVLAEIAAKYPDLSGYEDFLDRASKGKLDLSGLSEDARAYVERVVRVHHAAVSRRDRRVQVKVQVDGLKPGPWRVRTYRIDSVHANPFACRAWIADLLRPFVERGDEEGAFAALEAVEPECGLESGREDLGTREVTTGALEIPLELETPSVLFLVLESS